MIRKTLLITALGCLLAALAATLLARPSGAARRKNTIALLTYEDITKGSKKAAQRLGVRILVRQMRGLSPHEVTKLYESMIALHVDAIVSDGYDPAMKPLFRKVRKAGILLISSGDDIAGRRDLWAGYASPVTYGEALADALASQIGGKGEYAILDEQGEFPIGRTWKKIVAAYIAKAYPQMRLDGMLTETGVGDPAEVDSVKGFISNHPNLKGLISVTPTETYMAGEAITETGRIGQIFSAGNGGTLPMDSQLTGYVRTGASELVFADDPTKLGYLTVWAAHHLLTGHHFRPGAYQVGGPVGIVFYYAKPRELRLDQPITVTKKNLISYAKKY
jgi:ABC-type sugar transport system substrate-binding protein